MKLQVVFLSSSSVSLEVLNDNAYYSSEFRVFCNGEMSLLSSVNVFSLYDLMPNTKYDIFIPEFNLNTSFTTLEEYVSLNVRDFGAKGDGISDDTIFIQAGIMSTPKNGRLVIDKGIYKVTSLFLKSDIEIYLKEGAVILGETDRTKYPYLPKKYSTSSKPYYLGTWEGESDIAFTSVITGINVSNVKIYGKGIIDSNAQNSDWWVNHRVLRIARRPKGIFLNSVSNVEFQGITVKNTPSWNQHPYLSNNLKYIDMFLTSPYDSPTTDGIDPEGCKNVSIIGVKISVGDDCIAIKSGKIEAKRDLDLTTDNVVIRNCLMMHGHAGVTLGSEMSGGISNVCVSNCVFKNTDRGLRIKSQRGRGKDAIVDKVEFNNIIMDSVKVPLVINMMYKAGSDIEIPGKWDDRPQEVNDTTPHLGDFMFNNIHATSCSWGSGYFWGIPESPIRSVSILNSSFQFKSDAEEGVIAMTLNPKKSLKSGFTFINVKSYNIENTTISGHIGDDIIVMNDNMVDLDV